MRRSPVRIRPGAFFIGSTESGPFFDCISILYFYKKAPHTFTRDAFSSITLLFACTVVFGACKGGIVVTGGVDDLLAAGDDGVGGLIVGRTEKVLMELDHIAFQGDGNLVVIALARAVSEGEARGGAQLVVEDIQAKLDELGLREAG